MIREQQVTKSHTYSETIEKKCDICKKDLPLFSSRGDKDVEIKLNKSDYEYGGTVELFDCCVQCWTDVIVPLFKSKGAEPRTYDY